ncbi:hypothetical protein CYMTET_15718 [Cymbomonas tetramitiformis]|uniref:Uncharacterized protein n=1 Tax=Cymbomonas tetramitiformis TaxID=36881 RepID=A0AAE0GDS4_9CHLO|nr:hypothetical protein CYMTET_15718 [Cymbomonas tetramitiformis]
MSQAPLTTGICGLVQLDRRVECPSAAWALASAVFLSSVHTFSSAREAEAKPPEAQASERDSKSPFVYDELQEGIKRRMLSQQRLIEYLRAKSIEVDKIRAEYEAAGGQNSPNVTAHLRFNQNMTALEKQVNYDTQIILYNVNVRGARDRYMELYGCVRPSDAALETIASFSPLIEIGAGKGHWQRKLSDMGADVLAFDTDESVPRATAPNVMQGDVKLGDERQIRKHRNRALFICYPEGEMANKCLDKYSGEYLLYVGEGRGGVNANDAFFDMLERDWVCEKIVEVRPFPECFEKLYVMRRRNYRQGVRWWQWWR